MGKYHEIRAEYDENTITVYQAYNKEIAEKAVKNNQFVAPFSFNRMTWIKPSFLWMMERCGWGEKSNQESILAIKLKRESFEKALSEAVLSDRAKNVYSDSNEWQKLKKTARITAQWDPERDIRGGKLDFRSIQIGISRHLIQEYNEHWICKIEEITPLVKKIYKLKMNGETVKATLLLPHERPYEVSEEIRKKLGM